MEKIPCIAPELKCVALISSYRKARMDAASPLLGAPSVQACCLTAASIKGATRVMFIEYWFMMSLIAGTDTDITWSRAAHGAAAAAGGGKDAAGGGVCGGMTGGGPNPAHHGVGGEGIGAAGLATG